MASPSVRAARGRRLPFAAMLVAVMLVLAACADSVSGSPEVVPGAQVVTSTPDTSLRESPTSTTSGEISTPESTRPDTSEITKTSPTSASNSANTGPVVATVVSTLDGTITLASGTPGVTIDVYAEPLCPPCATFQQQYGNRIDAAVAQGKLRVRLHLMAFLNSSSASHTYSTRANAALLCVAARDAKSTAFTRFESTVFSPAFQPKENGSEDRTDAELAAAARRAGASTTAVSCLTSGGMVELVGKGDSVAEAALSSLGGGGTPSVYSGRQKINTTGDWLTALLGR